MITLCTIKNQNDVQQNTIARAHKVHSSQVCVVQNTEHESASKGVLARLFYMMSHLFCLAALQRPGSAGPRAGTNRNF